MLRATDVPPFFWWMTLSRPSEAANSSTSAPEPSFDLSSTRIHSQSRKVCDCIEAKVLRRNFTPLYTGVMTEMFGATVTFAPCFP